jgi:hypothetical protein
MRGAYIDLMGGKLRVYGLPWYGASTARIMESFAEQLAAARERETVEGVEYRLLLMHTGVEGIVPQLHGLPTRAQFEPLRGLVDYIALGHVHKQYALEDWLYNPGSTETWGAEESAWERGFYVVQIDTDAPDGQPRHHAEHRVNPRRPFLRFAFSVEGIASPTSLYEHFERFCREKAREHGEAEHQPAAGQREREPDEDASDEHERPGVAAPHERGKREQVQRDGVTPRGDDAWMVGEEREVDDRHAWARSCQPNAFTIPPGGLRRRQHGKSHHQVNDRHMDLQQSLGNRVCR